MMKFYSKLDEQKCSKTKEYSQKMENDLLCKCQIGVKERPYSPNVLPVITKKIRLMIKFHHQTKLVKSFLTNT